MYQNQAMHSCAQLRMRLHSCCLTRAEGMPVQARPASPAGVRVKQKRAGPRAVDQTESMLAAGAKWGVGNDLSNSCDANKSHVDVGCKSAQQLQWQVFLSQLIAELTKLAIYCARGEKGGGEGGAGGAPFGKQVGKGLGG